MAGTAEAVARERDRLTELDAAIGDGDHGANLQRGFAAVQTALGSAPEPATPGAVLVTAGMTLISSVGGASGPLYGSALRTLGKSLGEAETADGKQLAAALGSAPEPATPGAVLAKAGMTLISSVGGASGPLYGSALRILGKSLGEAAEADGKQLSAALTAALETLQRLGGAQPGDKTMVDAWGPAVAAFGDAVEGGGGPAAAAVAAAAAAEQAAVATTPLQAHKGRASYLGERSIGHQDPGATSTALLFRALADALTRPA